MTHGANDGGGPSLTLAAAQRWVTTQVTALREHERVPLADAAGRVLAEHLIAPRAVPPHDNAAVDGYAVAHADLASSGETALPLGGRAAAGHPLGQAAKRGEAVRIFTGAPLPAGLDTVVMQEDCRLEGDEVVLPAGVARGSNRRHAGEDIAEGARVLSQGRRLGAADLGLAASLGIGTLLVTRRLRAALFSTGDELADPGQPLPPGGIYDANRVTIAALLRAQGVTVTDLGILPDRQAAIAAALGEAANAHDLVVTSGGVSVGEEDHVKAAVQQQGSLELWRLAIKPGRPVAFGRVGAAIFVGLPGNPVAVVVTFVALLRPLLQRLSGETPRAALMIPALSGFSHRKKAGRQEWLRVSLARQDDGRWLASNFPRGGSGILSSLSETDGFAPLAEDLIELRPGDPLDVIPYGEVLA